MRIEVSVMRKERGKPPPDNIAAAEARATNGNLTVSLQQADRCGGMRVDDWCLRTGRHRLGAAGQREGDGPSHNGGDKAGALSWDHGSQGDTDLAEKLMVVENED